MNRKSFAISITVGIAVVLLLFVGTGATTILSTTYAQTATLGEPIFVEKGGDITFQREIGPNMTQYTFTSNGTMFGNIEYSKTGEYVAVSKGNNMIFDQGKGVLTTNDGSETANYTFIEVFNGTAYQGASVYSTNSTGELSILNNALVIYKLEEDESGNYSGTQWIWK
jgi:hypothetical protein